MRNSQRWVIIAALAVVAVLMPAMFLHFGDGPSMVMYPIWQITDYPLGGGSGVYSAPGVSFEEAIAAGIIAPIVLLATAAYIFFGMKGRISN